MGKFDSYCVRLYLGARERVSRLRAYLKDESGQGTTEYAILVGVLVVIAIVAINLFKPKLQELWDAIVEGMEAL